MLQLTWHSVDCFKRPQYPHCSDGCQVDVLQVQWVFNHPEENKMHRTNSLTKTSICVHELHELPFTCVLHFLSNHKRSFLVCLWSQQRRNHLELSSLFSLCPSSSCCDCIWMFLVNILPPFVFLQKHKLTPSVSNCVDTNVNEWVRVCEPL